jgi:predicted PurR-regulated permease PerM
MSQDKGQAPVPAGGRPPRGAPDAYPGPLLRTAADYGWRLLAVGTVAYFVLRLLSHLLTVVIPFVIALLVAALLHPVLAGLRRRGVRRGPATLLSVIAAVLVVGGLLTIVVVRAVNDFPQLGRQVNNLIPHIKRWLITGPLHVNATTVNNLSKTLTNLVNTHTSAIASTALSTGKSVLRILAGLVLTIFITVFLLYDGERIWTFLTRAAPNATRPQVDAAGRAAWQTLSHYVRGTLVVAVFHGVAVAIALAAFGVPLVLPLSVLVGLGAFVPLVGALVTGVVAVGVAGLTQGLPAAIAVVAVLLVDNQVEGHLLQPFVVGRYVRIHPLATVLSLATGAIVLGIFGAVIAVPTAACINAAVHAVLSFEVGKGPAEGTEERARPSDGGRFDPRVDDGPPRQS